VVEAGTVRRLLETIEQRLSRLEQAAGTPARLPETNRGVFKALHREQLISADLAERLGRMAGFRNVLAHGYADVINERVYAALGELNDVRSYVTQLDRYFGDERGR
jgi:uncharacterized protein YutE (UPF0331/DUF86 family)